MHQIFSLDKFILNPVMNRFGLQVLRKVLFKLAYNLVTYRYSNDDPDVKDFKAKGYHVIHDFLSEEEFRDVEREYYQALEEVNSKPKIDHLGHYQLFEVLKDRNINVHHKVDINDDKYPRVFKCLLYHNRLQEFIKRALGCSYQPFFKQVTYKAKFERTVQINPGDQSKYVLKQSSNAQFHSDAVYPVVKAYFLISDVTKDNGAFRYVPSSNLVSLKQIVRMYRESNRKDLDDVKKGVRKELDAQRYSDNETERYGSIKHFVYPKNTLFFVDTSGMHARGYFLPNKTREIVYIDCRHNPFVEMRNRLLSKVGS